MYKVRWFTVNWNNTYSKVIDEILLNIYDESKIYGFKAYKQQQGILYGAFIKKKEIEEKIENPLTNEVISYKKIMYEQTKFNLENKKIGIELINPNRSIQEVINTFSSLSNFNISVKNLEIDLVKFINLLKLDFNSLLISDIECKDIKIKNNTTIKIVAKNNRTDVYTDIDNFLENHEYIIEKIKCSIVIDNFFMSFELTNKGSFKTNKKNIEILVPIVKNNILKIIK